MKITIIGAGIGGLTTAIALDRQGIDFEIYESFAAFKSVGAGIMLANNAMQVYQHLGCYDAIEQAGFPFSHLNIATPQLNILSSAPSASTHNKLRSFAIHRGDLQRILLAQIPAEKIHLGKRLSTITSHKAATILHFEDGSHTSASIVLGADGIHSKVRDYVTSDSQIRNAHQNCWRGIAQLALPSSHQGQLYEVWDKKQRFGFVQIAPNTTYWYALNDATDDSARPPRFNPQLFSHYHPLIKNIIASTPSSDILRNIMMDLAPIDKWHKSNVCLLGDAAHATTPNMGQGACQSIEDALVFADCIAKHISPSTAFATYQKRRQTKVQKIVQTSWQIGKISHLNNSILVGLRNLALRTTPTKIMQQQQSFINTLT